MKNFCLCEVMRELWKEQQRLADFGKGFRFIHMQDCKDTIPFILFTKSHSTPFTAIINGIATPYFRVEKIDEESCCAKLTLLLPVDLKGWPALTTKDMYSLKKTDQCIHVKLCCFSAINPLPHELVGRPLPIIESKG